jgi:RND family efflux transporter MFP subunit
MSKIAVIMSIVLLVVFLAGCTGGDKGAGVHRETFNVPVMTISATTRASYTEVTGTVAGDVSVPVSTKLMSQITYMGFDAGERVSKGDVLARIDDSDFQAMRNEAAAYRAEAAAAQAEVDAVIAQGEAGKSQAEGVVQQAKAGLEQAETAYEDAKRDYERAERLYAEESIPEVHRDKAKLGMEIAEQRVEQARGAVAQAEGAVAQAEAMIAQAEAKKPQVAAKSDQATAKEEQAKAYQAYATLTAPFDGVITRKMAEPGQMAIPGHPLYMVEDDSSFRVKLSVPEHLAGGLSWGQDVTVVVDDPAGEGTRSLPATIDVIGAAANPGTHTVDVELVLGEVDGLFSGRFVRVQVPTGEREQLFVPKSAVIREGDQHFVWRASPKGVLNRVPVEIGALEDGKYPVIRGLKDGDRIVSQPTDDLYAGAQVAGS